MPTYEYRCKDCGQHLEVVQAFTDGPLEVCPNCAGQLRKVFGSIGITFKGSGFYRTDSRSGSTGSKRAAESSSGDSKSGDSKSGDSKSGDAKSGESSKSTTSATETKSSGSSSEAKSA